MLDTNVLISALLFPGAKMDAMMNCIFTQHLAVTGITFLIWVVRAEVEKIVQVALAICRK